MRYLSLFSGIEAATVAWEPLGWKAVAYAEIDPFASAVLAHRYPNVHNFGDVTKITEQQIASLGHIDLVVFGSPCQDLSIAGKRNGLSGERSGLFFTAIKIIRWARERCGCRFAIWENVPGAFSSNQGRDFAEVVSEMAGCGDVAVPANGWGKEGAAVGELGLLEWSVLDAQWFGLAQRRKRVFAIADFGDWQNRGPILLEPKSLRRDSPPSRQAGQSFTHDAAPCLTSSGRTGDTRGQDSLVSGFRMAAFGEYVEDGTASTMKARDYKDATDLAVYSSSGAGYWKEGVGPLRAREQDSHEMLHVVHGTQDPCVSETTAFALGRNSGQENVVAFAENSRGEVRLEGGSRTGTLSTGGGKPGQGSPTIASQISVRRLTPVECERLQGFPDNHTNIPYKNKLAPDGQRYKSLGNSMAVPCMRFIGERIKSYIGSQEQS